MTAPGVFAAVQHMYDADTAEQAQDAAREFLAAGGSPADVAALLAEWSEARDRRVQVIESTGVAW